MKRIIPLIFLLFISSVCFAQDPDDPDPGIDTTIVGKPSEAAALTETQSYLPNVVPSSPEVSSLGKYIDTPVSYYTGTPTISIPIYTVKNADIDVPVSISYHGGGIRVEEEASQVGLGWALNAGGMIRHQVRGLDDMRGVSSAWKSLRTLTTSGNNALCIDLGQGGYRIFSANFTGSSGTAAGVDLQNILAQMPVISGGEPVIDTELDLFSYTVNGKSGQFVIEPMANGSYLPRSLTKDAVNIKVTGTTPAAWNFTLVFPDGTEYTFDQRERQEVSDAGPKQTIQFQYGQYGSLAPLYSAPLVNQVTAWYLTQIRSAHRLPTDIVTFSYTTGGYVNQLPNGVESYVATTSSSTTSDFLFRWKVTETRSQEVTLDQITFTNGKVKFFRSSRTDRPSGSLKLDRIEVQTPSGELVKKVQFQYDYFTSSSTTASPTFDYIKKRLKLLSVQETTGTNPIPPYQFTYNTTVNLPDKNSYQQDYWGFYNGATTNDTKGTGSAKGTMLPPDVGAGTNLKLPSIVAGGANRATNATYLTANMLTSITHPMGGKTVYNWQANSFTNGYQQTAIFPVLNVQDNIGNAEILGGGVRIGKIEDQQADGTVSKQSVFEYKEPGTEIKSGKLMAPLTFLEWVGDGILYSSACRHPMGSSAQGNPLGYNKVIAYQGSDRLSAGYTVYHYENKVEQIDNTTFCMSWGGGTGCTPITLYSVGGYNCNPFAGPVDIYTKSITESSMPNRVHHLNGSLLDETFFNSLNKPVKATINVHESVGAQILTNYKTKRLDGFRMGFSYQIESAWNRLKESRMLMYDQDGDINHYNQTVTEYTYNDAYPFASKVTSTDSKTGAAKVSVTIAGQPAQVFDRVIETSYVYPFDLNDPASVAMTAANLIASPVETIVRLGKVTGSTQTFTPISYRRIIYGGSPFFVPQKLESRVGAASVATTDIDFMSYDSRGNLLSYKERDGVTNRLDYYGTGDIGKTDLLKSLTTADGSTIPQTTSYDHKVLVGPQTISDQNAKIISYDYDDKSRLKTVKNADGKVRASYCYNYAGQIVECGALAPTGSIAATDTVLIFMVPSGPLPVTLLDFEAKRLENHVLLHWSTTAETNSDRFEIERSTDGKKWLTLGMVQTAGESNQIQYYSFTDSSPESGGLSRKENLYRLKMLDKDGTFTNSRIRIIVFDGDQVSISPNPVTVGQTLKISSNNQDKISSIRIFDANGKMVLESAATTLIDVSTISSGLYIVQISYSDGSQSTHRVVKE